MQNNDKSEGFYSTFFIRTFGEDPLEGPHCPSPEIIEIDSAFIGVHDASRSAEKGLMDRYRKAQNLIKLCEELIGNPASTNDNEIIYLKNIKDELNKSIEGYA